MNRIDTFLVFLLAILIGFSSSVRAEPSWSAIAVGLTSAGIQKTALDEANVYFDFNDDDFAVRTSWVGPRTGILVRSDRVEGARDLVQPVPSLLLALRSLDTNKDQDIDASDTSFNNLKIWVDTNGNGRSDPGEVCSLPELGIKGVRFGIEGAESKPAIVLLADGSSGPVEAVMFETRPVDTTYKGNYTLNPETLLLPNLRGYGKMKDLFVAMSLNPSLIARVRLLTDRKLQDAALFNRDVAGILNRWADVENVPPGSRGLLMNARYLATLEKITGTRWTSLSGVSNPERASQVDRLNLSYFIFFSSMKDRLLAQGPLARFLPGTKYNYASDELTGWSDFNPLIGYLGQVAPRDPGEEAAFWSNIVPTLNSIARGIGVSPDTYRASLEETLATSTLPNMRQAIESHTVVFGTNYREKSPDKMIFAATSDRPHVFVAGVGENVFNGGAGNDTFVGGFGKNVMYGKGGTNTFFCGEGLTEIFSEGAGDRVYCRAGDAVIHLLSDNLENAMIDGGSGSTTLVVAGKNLSTTRLRSIAALEMQGTVTLSGGHLSQIAKISASHEGTIVATSPGTYDFQGKTIEGSLTVKGTRKDDLFFVGQGKMMLVGGGGSDTYEVSPVKDELVIDNRASSEDTEPRGLIKFLPGIDPETIWFQRKKNDLTITLLGTNGKVRVVDWFGVDSGAKVRSFRTFMGWTLDGAKIPIVIDSMELFRIRALKVLAIDAWKRKERRQAAKLFLKYIGDSLGVSLFEDEDGDELLLLTQVSRESMTRQLRTSFWVQERTENKEKAGY